MFLIGPNASGKSNLLDALRFLRDLASTGGGFGDAVRRRGGVSTLRCLAARRPSHVMIGVELESERGDSWAYARTQERTRNARMRRIRKALQVAVPHLEEIELTRDARGVPHLRARYQHWRPHGAWHTEEQLSDGTLRLMGLLWATMDGKGPLLLEEPELSLHPEIVRLLPQMLARIQRRTKILT